MPPISPIISTYIMFAANTHVCLQEENINKEGKLFTVFKSQSFIYLLRSNISWFIYNKYLVLMVEHDPIYIKKYIL